MHNNNHILGHLTCFVFNFYGADIKRLSFFQCSNQHSSRLSRRSTSDCLTWPHMAYQNVPDFQHQRHLLFCANNQCPPTLDKNSWVIFNYPLVDGMPGFTWKWLDARVLLTFFFLNNYWCSTAAAAAATCAGCRCAHCVRNRPLGHTSSSRQCERWC